MTPDLKSEDILVRVQDTPNPSAVKFITNVALKNAGNATFTKNDEIPDMPLVRSLLDIPGVEQVYFFQNTVTVTHTDELPAEIIKDQVKAVLKTRIPVHNPEFEGPDSPKVKAKPDRSNLSPELRMIEDILDRTIRPGLQSDGGDIEVLEFKDNMLKILYQGACGGCPSAMMGTLDAIQSILRHEMDNPEIIVEPV